jgi:hypothetical protein
MTTQEDDKTLCRICEKAHATHMLLGDHSVNEDSILVCYRCLTRRTPTAKEKALIAARKAA